MWGYGTEKSTFSTGVNLKQNLETYVSFPSSLNEGFCLFSVTLKKLSKIIWLCLDNTRSEEIFSGERSQQLLQLLRHRALQFMWTSNLLLWTWQPGIVVRLGSCWQTIPGHSAISSCFPPQRPCWKWIGLIYFAFTSLTWKTELFMCIYCDLGFQ